MLSQLDLKQIELELALNSSSPDSIIYIKTSGAWTPNLSLDGENFKIINYYSFRVPNLKQTATLFASMNPVWIHDIVGDAGGTRVSKDISRIEIEKIEFFCTKLNNTRNPETDGKMLTSTGDWVFPNKWDRIEGTI